MANERAKHAFGTLENVDSALDNGIIDAYDILFVKDANGKPYVGWIDKEGQKVICDDSAEFAELEGQIATKANAEDLAQIESELATKANIADVDAKLEAALAEHHTEKYEVSDIPVGTLVNLNEREVRIMCPKDTVWEKQTVGNGGDPNCYYMTFKTYVYDDNIVGYKEHIGDKVDAEILTDFKTDKYGRRYQPTWLALARYDEATNTWAYYGANSNESKYVGWDYRIDFYDANNKVIASDSIRINLSNEECHSTIRPYYGASEMTEVETKIDEAAEETLESANAYTDAQIEAKIAEVASAYEVIEF